MLGAIGQSGPTDGRAKVRKILRGCEIAGRCLLPHAFPRYLALARSRSWQAMFQQIHGSWLLKLAVFCALGLPAAARAQPVVPAVAKAPANTALGEALRGILQSAGGKVTVVASEGWALIQPVMVWLPGGTEMQAKECPSISAASLHTGSCFVVF